MKRLLHAMLGTCGLVLASGIAQAQNSIAVNSTAAMGSANGGTACGGNMCGLEVVFPGGSTNPAKVVDESPNDQSVYRATFWYDASNLATNPSATGFFHVPLRTTETTLVRSPIMLLMTQKFNLYRLSARAGTNTAGVFRITNRIDLTGANKVQVEWSQSSAPGVAAGDMVVRILEGPQAGECVSIRDFTGVGLNNSNMNIDDVHLGAVGNVSPSISGSEYFDEFESYETLTAGFSGSCTP
jgi:hypothetical protein